MAWRDLEEDLAELFGDVKLPVNKSQLALEGFSTNEALYERIKRYLKTPGGKAALKRYQSKPEVKERRQFLERLRRLADPERYRAYRRACDAKRQADPVRRERMLRLKREAAKRRREAKLAATVNSANGG